MKVVFYLGLFLLFLSVFPQQSNAQYGSCSEYGTFAIEDYNGYCKCMSGYVFDDNLFGEPYCVSGDSVCRDKYGYGAKYDSLGGSCGCSYGYVLGKDSIGRTQCISETDACQNQLGYNSRSTYGGRCECDYGYVIDGGQCVYGSTHCRSKHGLYSGYDSLSNSCECDEGYTFDDDYQCVEKQNNVYFLLKELDEDENRAIIESTYNYQDYLVSYGVGCISIGMYEGRNIVVNLGTDFYVNLFDKIVLPNQGQTCSIMDTEEVGSDYTLIEEEIDYVNFYIPAQPTPKPQVPAPLPKTSPKPKVEKKAEVKKVEAEVVATSTAIEGTSTPEVKKQFWFKRFWNFLRGKK